MLFNLFGKKKKGEMGNFFKDKVYITSAGKMNACVKLAKEYPEGIFIAWFTDTANVYKAFFKENGVSENVIIEADFLTIEQLENHEPVFLEHHPLSAKEIELSANWPYTSLNVFSAMDEPLFKHFGSDKMIPLIKLLGIKESEAIEHSYVTESIVKGQNKIAAKVLIEQPAYSQAEWMQRNMEA